MTKQILSLVEIMAARPVLNRKDLARRYSIDLDTVDRWHARGVLPPGFYLPGSRFPYWRPFEIESNERRSPKLKKKLSAVNFPK